MQSTSSSVVQSTVQTEKTTTEIRLHSISHEPTAFTPTPVAVARWWKQNGSFWTALVWTGLHGHKKTITKDLCNRLEAERRGWAAHRGNSPDTSKSKVCRTTHRGSQAKPVTQPSSLGFSLAALDPLHALHPNYLIIPVVGQCQNVILNGLWSTQQVSLVCMRVCSVCTDTCVEQTVRVLTVVLNGKRTVWVM